MAPTWCPPDLCRKYPGLELSTADFPIVEDLEAKARPSLHKYASLLLLLSKFGAAAHHPSVDLSRQGGVSEWYSVKNRKLCVFPPPGGGLHPGGAVLGKEPVHNGIDEKEHREEDAEVSPRRPRTQFFSRNRTAYLVLHPKHCLMSKYRCSTSNQRTNLM